MTHRKTPLTDADLAYLDKCMLGSPSIYSDVEHALLTTVKQLRQDLEISENARLGHVRMIADLAKERDELKRERDEAREERDELVSENYWKTPNR
jgi:hypothetical protein